MEHFFDQPRQITLIVNQNTMEIGDFRYVNGQVKNTGGFYLNPTGLHEIGELTVTSDTRLDQKSGGWKLTLNSLPDASGAVAVPIIVKIDKEDIQIEPNIIIGWQIILEAEAHNPARVDIKVPVAGEGSVEFHPAILSNLRSEIATARSQQGNDRKIFRNLSLRYHPDLYRGASPEAQSLAGEYTKALGALRQIGEI